MTRRKWRIVYPGHAEVATFPSKRKAYECVENVRDEWAAGSASGQLTVQIDEGYGWEPYEHINFAEEGAA